jgi:hypothetical protein
LDASVWLEPCYTGFHLTAAWVYANTRRKKLGLQWGGEDANDMLALLGAGWNIAPAVMFLFFVFFPTINDYTHFLNKDSAPLVGATMLFSVLATPIRGRSHQVTVLDPGQGSPLSDSPRA